MDIKFALITASDTRSETEDTAGAALKTMIELRGWTVASYVVVSDDRALIAQAIEHACDEVGADIVITCGGTGLSPRDVTPEATQDVCDRNVCGIAEAIRASSLKSTRRAMLSRAVCMQRGTHLVINFPGSEKAVHECWEAIYEQFEHAKEMSDGAGH